MSSNTPQDCTTDFTAALIRRDIDTALALLTDEVVFFYSNGAAIVGKAAFAALMTASWKLVEDYEYAATDAQWLAQSDAVASVIYGFTWSGVLRGGKVGGGGRATRVLANDGSGWRIAHEHLSPGLRHPSEAAAQSA